MKLSIVLNVLNSHEIVRRQMLYLEKIGIPDETEIILVDDGSDPPLRYEGKLPVKIHYTNDKRPWTWALARNAGARLAQGEIMIMHDIDHIITPEILNIARNYKGVRMGFKREFGVLLEDGTFTQDKEILIAYGLPRERMRKGLRFGNHPGHFIIRRDVFFEMGCYAENLARRTYPQGEDNDFKRKWHRYQEKIGKGSLGDPYSPIFYMFPNGYYCGDVDFNPFGLFHNLTRKTEKNTFYKRGLSHVRV